jgi:hypothetical protein
MAHYLLFLYLLILCSSLHIFDMFLRQKISTRLCLPILLTYTPYQYPACQNLINRNEEHKLSTYMSSCPLLTQLNVIMKLLNEKLLDSFRLQPLSLMMIMMYLVGGLQIRYILEVSPLQ